MPVDPPPETAYTQNPGSGWITPIETQEAVYSLHCLLTHNERGGWIKQFWLWSVCHQVFPSVVPSGAVVGERGTRRRPSEDVDQVPECLTSEPPPGGLRLSPSSPGFHTRLVGLSRNVRFVGMLTIGSHFGFPPPGLILSAGC